MNILYISHFYSVLIIFHSNWTHSDSAFIMNLESNYLLNAAQYVIEAPMYFSYFSFILSSFTQMSDKIHFSIGLSYSTWGLIFEECRNHQEKEKIFQLNKLLHHFVCLVQILTRNVLKTYNKCLTSYMNYLSFVHRLTANLILVLYSIDN